jgi:ATP-dependent Lon protease
LRQLLIPQSNLKDLRDVPDEVKKQMTFSFVATMDEVLRLALLPADVGETTLADQRAESALDSAASLPVTRESGPQLNAERV